MKNKIVSHYKGIEILCDTKQEQDALVYEFAKQELLDEEGAADDDPRRGLPSTRAWARRQIQLVYINSILRRAAIVLVMIIILIALFRFFTGAHA